MKTDTTTNKIRVDNPLLNDADHLYEPSGFYRNDLFFRSSRLQDCTLERAAELGSVEARLGMLRDSDTPSEKKVEWVRRMVTEDYPAKESVLTTLGCRLDVKEVFQLISDEGFERMISKDNPDRVLNLFSLTRVYLPDSEEPTPEETPEWVSFLKSFAQETGSISEAVRQRRLDRCIEEEASDRGLHPMEVRIDYGLVSEDEERRFRIGQAESGCRFDLDRLYELLDDEATLNAIAVASALRGNTDAIGYVADLLLTGGESHIPLDELHRLCEGAGDRVRASLIGMMVDNGITGPRVLFEHLSEKASEGREEDQYLLARCYENGYGNEESEDAAREWAVKAADQGYLPAIIMYDGLGEWCPPKYIEMCERMAEQGDAEACAFLCMVYHNYSCESIPDDYDCLKSSAEMYRRAKELGYDCGSMFFQDQLEAILWAEEVAETPGRLDVGAVLEEAEKRFSWEQYTVLNVLVTSPRDEPELIHCRASHLDAFFRPDKVSEEDILLFKKAAGMGFAPSMYSLYEAYLKGSGVEQSTSEALGWLRRAAEAGHVEARYELARRLETGDGVEKDLDAAVEWYARAANQCDVDAYGAYLRLAGCE